MVSHGARDLPHPGSDPVGAGHHGLVAEWDKAGSLRSGRRRRESSRCATSWRNIPGLAAGQDPRHHRFLRRRIRRQVRGRQLWSARRAARREPPVRRCGVSGSPRGAPGGRQSPRSQQRWRSGPDGEGKLTAIEVKGGAAAARVRGRLCRTGAQHLSVSGYLCRRTRCLYPQRTLAAFRAPGHPQEPSRWSRRWTTGERLGIDPLVLRDKNDNHAARREERRRGACRIWLGPASARRPRSGEEPGHLRRGLGMAQRVWYYLVNLASHAEVRIHRDGTVERSPACGTSAAASPAGQVVAGELGVPLDRVKVTLGDPSSTGSGLGVASPPDRSRRRPAMPLSPPNRRC